MGFSNWTNKKNIECSTEHWTSKSKEISVSGTPKLQFMYYIGKNSFLKGNIFFLFLDTDFNFEF